MEKFTILCGMKNFTDAEDFMTDVLISLRNDEVYPVNCDWRYLTFETKYTRVGFIYDISKQPLNGVEADAVFGKEPYKQTLAPYLKTGHAYTMGDGLVDYIGKMEVEGKYREANEAYEKALKEHTVSKQIYISTGRGGAKSELCRRYMESLVEKDEFVNYSKLDCDITHDLWKRIGSNGTYGIMENHDNKPLLSIENVIFNNPATIVFWADGTKTVVHTQDEPYDPEKGLAMAMCKKMLGNKRDYYHTFKHWLKKCKEK